MAEKFVIERGMVDLDAMKADEVKASVNNQSARVFRVTTLKDGDYDSIPLQRLKNTFVAKSVKGTALFWILLILVAIGVIATMIYVHSQQKLRYAQRVAIKLAQYDTSRNDVVKWLMWRKKALIPLTPTSSSWHLKKRGYKPVEEPESAMGQSLRLPLGLAVTLGLEVMAEDRRARYEEGPAHNRKYMALTRLKDSLPMYLYQDSHTDRIRRRLTNLLQTARRVQLLCSLPQNGKTGDEDQMAASLKRFARCTHKGAEVPCAEYRDVMGYEGASALLYWGGFYLLQFHGPGVMYWNNGEVAYRGDFRAGSASGYGRLYDPHGRLAWEGTFSRGRPKGTPRDVWHNYLLTSGISSA